MKILEDVIKKNGFTYKLHKREGDLAIYEQWDYDDPDHPWLVAYEVFVVTITKDFVIKGKEILGGEKFPGNEDFGYTAWTYSAFGGTQLDIAKEKAYKKFESLKEKQTSSEIGDK